MIPNNLLGAALSAIGHQAVIYYQYLGRSTNSVGNVVTSYSKGTIVYGKVNALNRKVYMNNGLDFNKKYILLYVSENFTGVQCNVSGDQITFNGNFYQAMDTVDWYEINGWKSILCVQIAKLYA